MAAGLGFKTFATGDVLSATDVNGYLMQGVLVFASATARDTAITSPQEGQTVYLKDTDVIQCYSGSAWVTKSGSSTTFSGARVTKSANQSIATATYTTVTFDQEPLDVGGYHDNATNNSRLTIPTGKTGYFLVQWNLHSYNVGAMAYKLLKNGSSIVQFSDSYNWTTGTEVDFTNQWLGALSAGDYVEIQIYQGSGGARNVYGSTGVNEPSWFQITYLGA